MDNTFFTSGLPPEIAAEAESLKRRQSMTEALLRQSMQPLPNRGRRGPHVLEGLAQLAQAFVARQREGEGKDAWAQLGNRYQQGVADAMLNYQRTKAGTPGTSETIMDEQANDGEGQMATIETPGKKGDPRKAVEMAMSNAYLRNNPLIQADAKQLQPTTLGRSLVIPATGEVVATDSTWQAEQAAARQARLDQIEAQAREGRITREEADRRSADLRRELQAQAARDREAMVRLTAGLRQPPAPQPVTPVTIQDPNDPNKTVVIDGRTRQVLGAGPKATDAGKFEQKRNFNMQGLGDILTEAETILGDKANPPTGSGVGAAWDAAAGFVGLSPKGSTQADQLRAISGALVSKMPRMEGPQSDKDVLLYKQSAGDIGNAALPVERRVEALKTVRKLWAQYEKKPGAAASPAAKPAAGTVLRFDAQGNPLP